MHLLGLLLASAARTRGCVVFMVASVKVSFVHIVSVGVRIGLQRYLARKELIPLGHYSMLMSNVSMSLAAYWAARH